MKRCLPLLLGFLLGCPPSTTDAGVRDAGPPDPPEDAGMVYDAGSIVDAGPVDSGIVPPPSDLTERMGGPNTVDIAAWNIENFPKHADSADLVAGLIWSLDLDIVAVCEMSGTNPFFEIVDRLPGYEGIVSTHVYSDGWAQKIGYIYRASMVTLETSLILTNDAYVFPRPPMMAHATIDDGVHPVFDFALIAVHLKAGTGTEDRERRTLAMIDLEDHVRGMVDDGAETDIVILGDFNEILTHPIGEAVFAPFRDSPALYDVETEELADNGFVSFIPSGVILDHIVTTASLADNVGFFGPVIPRLDNDVSGFVGRVSDHLPVVLSLAFDTE